MSGENEPVVLTPERATLLQNTEALLSDPETRSQFFGLMKKKNPEMVIPELDVKSQLEGMMAAEREKREKLEQEIRDDRTRAEIKERRARLNAKGLNDEDITAVEKMMTEKGIVSHDTAAEFYLQSRQLAGGSTTDGQKKNDMPDLYAVAKEKHGGNIRAAAKEAALASWREGKKRLGFA